MECTKHYAQGRFFSKKTTKQTIIQRKQSINKTDNVFLQNIKHFNVQHLFKASAHLQSCPF